MANHPQRLTASVDDLRRAAAVCDAFGGPWPRPSGKGLDVFENTTHSITIDGLPWVVTMTEAGRLNAFIGAVAACQFVPDSSGKLRLVEMIGFDESWARVAALVRTRFDDHLWTPNRAFEYQLERLERKLPCLRVYHYHESDDSESDMSDMSESEYGSESEYDSEYVSDVSDVSDAMDDVDDATGS